MTADAGRLIAAYLSSLAMQGFRPSSIKARGSGLRLFERTLHPRGLHEATRLDCEAFLGRPLKPESRKAYRNHLKAFYGWAVEEEYLAVDPTVKLRSIRVPKAVPRPMSHPDLVTALAGADARMASWLLLMALGGLRCIEVAALRPQDLTPSGTGTLLYLQECKGGGTATVPAHPLVLESLGQVPIRNGLWWSCSAHHVSATVGAYLRSVGVRATAHQMRHYAGTAWYRASGHDLLATATLLRHANVQTTMVYAQMDPVRPAEVVNAVQLGLPAPKAENPPIGGLRIVPDLGERGA